MQITSLKKALAGVALAASLGAVTPPAAAVVFVTVAPPAPQVEVVPPPRHGYVWAPGYWRWDGHRHIWVAGAWMRERPGYVYRHPEWVERDGRWVMEGGHWNRHDRDGDGVPNRYDHRPDNPNRS